jgi:hypothetical protein
MKMDQEDMDREKQILNEIQREKEDQANKKESSNDGNLQGTGKV